MKEILVFSLSRYGDHIQSTPLLRSLRSRYPDARITIAAESRFADILPLMGGMDDTVLYDNRDIAWKLAMEDDPLTSYAAMDRFVRQLEGRRFDLVVNITLSRLSDFIVSLVPAAEVSGTVAASRGNRRVISHWVHYFLATLNGDNRRRNRINLVDVFTGIGGGVPDGKPVELRESGKGKAFAEAFLTRHGLAGKRIIGLQLGASTPIRCWEMASFAALSDRLQERMGCGVILFGSPGERPLADEVLNRTAHAPVDAVGKTGIEELFSLVKRCDLLVTNDTGTMHFAAAGGVPSVMLCLGPAFFRGTGPYNAGNIALQPALPCSPCPYNFDCSTPVCKKTITVEAVEGACRLLLDNQAVSPAVFSGVRVFRSMFGEDGFLEWQGLCNVDHAEEERDRSYELMWKRFLTGSEMPAMGGLSGPPLTLEQLVHQGVVLTEQIIDAACRSCLPVEQLRLLGSSEAMLEEELRQVGIRHPEMATLVDYLKLMRDNLPEEGLEQIARATRQLYATGGKILSCL